MAKRKFSCNWPIKRNGSVYADTIELDDPTVIDQLTASGAISETPQESKPETDVDDLASAIQRMRDKDPNKENPDWWTEAGLPELRPLAAEAGVDKVSARERAQALEALDAG